MTTTSTARPMPKTESRTNWKAFIATALQKSSDTLGDSIVTVFVTMFLIVYIAAYLPMYSLTNVPGLLITAMLVQLLIRIVHRFDDHYTTDELAERMIEMEHDIREQLNRIEANQ